MKLGNTRSLGLDLGQLPRADPAPFVPDPATTIIELDTGPLRWTGPALQLTLKNAHAAS